MAASGLVRLVIILSLFSARCRAKKCALYSSDDPIVCLEGDEVSKLVTNSENCWAVEFYSSWCGHCHDFAPTFKEVARDVTKWGGRLKVAVIDCSESKNQDTCRKYNVMGYPSVKLIHAKETDPQNAKSFVGGRSADEVKISYLELLKTQNDPPGDWPNLSSLSFGDYLRLESSHPSTNIVLAFSDAKSSISRELVVMFAGKDQVMVRAVIDDPVMASHMSVDTANLPVVVLIRNKERTLLKPSSNEKTLSYFEEKINHWIDPKNVQVQTLPPHTQQQMTVDSKHDTKQESITSPDDIVSAVGYAFHHEIPLHSIISGPAFKALLEFVMLLEQVFARLLPRVSGTLKKLGHDLQIAKSHRFITLRDWLKLIDSEHNPEMYIFPSKPVWHSCRGSSPEFRGYPCSLWTLMHTVTVLTHPAVNQLPRTKSFHLSVSYGSQDALRIMANFIKNFFTCVECREHFVKMAEDVHNYVKSNADSILWLWCAHNAVNRRISGAKSEDPNFPKVQFPALEKCPLCHVSTTSNDRSPDHRCVDYHLAQQNDGMKWNEHEVMFYLCTVYGHNQVTPDKCKLLATASDVGRHSIPTEAKHVSRGAEVASGYQRPLSSARFNLTIVGVIMLCFVFAIVYGRCRRRLPRLLKVAGYHSHLM